MHEAAAASLYGKSLVVDATAPLAPFSASNPDLTPDELIAAYADAGVTCAVFTVVDDFPNSIEQSIKILGLNRQYVLGRPDRCILVDQVSDVFEAKKHGKLAVAFAFQGTNALLGELSLVEVYRRLGVIQMLLAYNSGNLAADGCHESRNAGLTHFGRQLVKEMNRVGVVIDLTHVGVRSSLEAIELTTAPPLFSHSTPKHFCAHDRNITDEQIRACAQKEGVVCLSGVGLFMDAEHGRATASRLAETIDYVVQLTGPRHAGFGMDFIKDAEWMRRFIRSNAALYGDGAQYPKNELIDFAPPAILPQVVANLSRRGYAETDIQSVLGTNYLRVLEKTLACASSARHPEV